MKTKCHIHIEVEGNIKEIPDFPKIEKGEDKTVWLEDGIQKRIIEHIPEKHRPIFLFMIRQGVRPSEARALHFEDIDRKNKTITICRNFSGKEYKEWTKTKKIRVLPLDD